MFSSAINLHKQILNIASKPVDMASWATFYQIAIDLTYNSDTRNLGIDKSAGVEQIGGRRNPWGWGVLVPTAHSLPGSGRAGGPFMFC